MTWIAVFWRIIAACQFIRKYRARQQAAALSERLHQLELLGRIASMIESLHEGHSTQITDISTALGKLASANQAHADAFTTWVTAFSAAPPIEPAPPAEDQSAMNEFLEDLHIHSGDVIPAEFKLAFDLQRGITDIGSQPPT